MGCCLGTKIKANSDQISSDQIAQDGDRNDQRHPSSRIPLNLRTEGEILSSALNLKCFSFKELRSATREFRPDSFLGGGGFGFVFKGWIDEETLMPAKPKTGMVIAVKKLNQDGFQGHHEWLTEINYLGQLHHPNLVKLIGYCSEEEQRLLVYEFMTRGSLENHLFKRSSCFKPLPWNLRMKIVLDAAIGLAFLHDQKVKVIYRDFKAANILLDSDYNGKLSDFGLARDGPITGEKSYVSTRVLGTQGYAAPEYMATGRLSTRSDIYSFGVVLLEVMTGRRVLDPKRPSSEHDLISWSRPYLKSKRKIFRIMDTKIQGQYPSVAAVRVGKLAIQCLSVDPRFRPTMREIVAELEEIVREDCAGSHAVGLLFEKQELQEGCQEGGSKPAADCENEKKHRRAVNVA